jgi:hypothetical protein
LSRDQEAGFANRWSRLKQEAKAAEPEVEVEAGAVALDERSDEEVLAELDLPDPDTLKAGDDFKGFMAKAVPARLRNRALRKLWISDPVLANLDELIDYGEDFSDASNVIEDLKTAYQVGKGFANQVTPKVDPEVAGAGEEDPADADAEAEAEVEAGAGDAVDEPDFRDALSEPEPPVRLSGHSGPDSQPRRRMRFRVAEE